MQERLDAGEIARVLVGVEEDDQASAQLVAELLEIGGQVTEDRDGDPCSRRRRGRTASRR